MAVASALERSIVRIGLETYHSFEEITKRESILWLGADHHAVGVDDMARGSSEAVATLRANPEFVFLERDLADGVGDVFQAHAIDAVFDFAAVAFVAESGGHPGLDAQNVTANTVRFVDAMVSAAS